MNPSITDRRPAKVRFFVIYSLSVLLIVLLFSSFLMPANTGSNPAVPTKEISQRAIIIELLHQRIAPLQLATVYFLENSPSAEGLKEVENQKASFLEVVDSVRKQTADLNAASEKAAIENLLQSFTLDAERKLRLAATHSTASQKPVATSDTAARGELERLKILLVQKEETIAALERQKQAPAVESRDAEASVWKERYNRLKSSRESASSQLETLKNSYKEVVEDNRRLIAQLQAARAGKN